MKLKNIMAVLVLILAMFAFPVHADSANFDITKVEVGGITVNQGDVVYAERGERVPVVVFYQGAYDPADENVGRVYDVRAVASIEGYEYGVVDDSSDLFQILPSVSGKKTLWLQIPSDIDASGEYDLRVELRGAQEDERATFSLMIEEPRHSVEIYDVLINPESNIKPGQPVYVNVRVENMGDNVENNIKVRVAIPELDISDSAFVDELITSQDLNQDKVVYAKKDAATSKTLVLIVPEDAEAKDYELEVAVDYNRGHSVAKKVYTVSVAKGGSVAGASEVMVSVDSIIKSANAGESVAYKMSVANLGAAPKVLTFEASEGATVTPASITLQPNKVAEVSVFASADASKTFSVKVLENGKVLDEKVLTLNVQNVAGADFARKALQYGFFALLIVLVILGIVVLAKRLSGSREDEGIESKSLY